MHWLLVVILLDVDQGPKMFMRQAFATEAQCNATGAELRGLRYKDPNLKSVSVCIPDSFYREEGLKSEKL